MALEKTKTVNGIDYSYWVAEPHYAKKTNKTDIIMLLFSSEAARNGDQKPIRERFAHSMDGCYFTGEEVYAFVKESRMVENTDEEGATIEVESNFFADAVDLNV